MVTERYVPIWGGAENQLRQLIPHLVGKGCSVEIVTRRWHKEMPTKELIDGVMVNRIGIPGTSFLARIYFVFLLFWYLLLVGSRVDIYHSHGAVKMGAICWLAGVLNRKKNVVKIATAGHIPRLAGSVFGRVALAMFKRSSAIISMTREIDEELSDIGTSPIIIHTITNGVDCNRFHPFSVEQRIKWKINNGLPSESIVLLFSSRLVFRKGLDVLLDAWPEISQEIPDVYLLVVGSGIDQIDSIEKEMSRKVKEQGLVRVIFVGETDTPETYFGVADCFLFPSRKEGFPNALMEAMASQLPSVASRIGGVDELIINGENGELFEPENSRNLAEKCVTLFKNEKALKVLGENARQQMLDFYSFEKIAKSYTELYGSLIKTL